MRIGVLYPLSFCDNPLFLSSTIMVLEVLYIGIGSRVEVWLRGSLLLKK